MPTHESQKNDKINGISIDIFQSVGTPDLL